MNKEDMAMKKGTLLFFRLWCTTFFGAACFWLGNYSMDSNTPGWSWAIQIVAAIVQGGFLVSTFVIDANEH